MGMIKKGGPVSLLDAQKRVENGEHTGNEKAPIAVQRQPEPEKPKPEKPKREPRPKFAWTGKPLKKEHNRSLHLSDHELEVLNHISAKTGVSVRKMMTAHFDPIIQQMKACLEAGVSPILVTQPDSLADAYAEIKAKKGKKTQK